MKRHILLLSAILLVVGGCKTSFKVTSDTPAKGDYNRYSSFKFFNPKNIPAANFSFAEEDQDIIFDAVASELNLRGYKSVQDADLMVKIQGGTSSTQEERNDRDPFYDPYYNRYGTANYYRYGDPYFDRNSNRYRDISKKETTIIIDIIDIDKDKLIWQGVGVGVLGKKGQEVEGKIRDAIHQIFLEYPGAVIE
jgi:hypothetical protein